MDINKPKIILQKSGGSNDYVINSEVSFMTKSNEPVDFACWFGTAAERNKTSSPDLGACENVVFRNETHLDVEMSKLKDSTHYVYAVRATDRAGNYADSDKKITVWTTPPTVV